VRGGGIEARPCRSLTAHPRRTQGVTCGSTVKLKHSVTKFHLHSHEVA
jgi:hypothetical protein